MEYIKKTNKPKHCFVDLFAGCGGLSLGLEKAGFHPIFVNELNKDALASYLKNREFLEPKLSHPNFHEFDIKKIVGSKDYIKSLIENFKKEFDISIDSGELYLLVGGPPCQGFSGIGHRRSYSVDKEQLPSNHLFQDMAWMINTLKPKIFLFENVKGLLSAKWTKDGKKGEIFEDVLESFRSIHGYRIEHSLVLAKDYGAPQNRPRVLIVGVRNDIDISEWIKSDSRIAGGFIPKPTYGAPDLIDLLGDLVDQDFEYGGCNYKYVNPPFNELQAQFRKNHDGSVSNIGSKLTEQEYSNHSYKVIEKFSHMKKIMVKYQRILRLKNLHKEFYLRDGVR